MTEETRKLFNAPWKLKHDYSCVYRVGKKHENEDWSEVFDILDKKENEHYVRCYDEKTANRLARLPELYDALVEAVYDACQDCLVERSYVSEDEDYDLIENGCVYPERDCCEQCRGWIALLRKVRDGK